MAGLVCGLFGVLWTVIAVAVTAEMPWPYVGLVFPALGVLITLVAWSNAAYHFVNATSQQRFTEYDFVTQCDEPAPQRLETATKCCAKCAAPLQAAFKFCPQCGAKI